MKVVRRINNRMVKLKKYIIATILLFASLTIDNRASMYLSDDLRQLQLMQQQQHITNFVDVVLPVPIKQIKVRLTCYWARGADTDIWSENKESTTGTRLKSGISAAVDPRVIPYYSKITIPNGPTLIAHDTGTDVINRKASNGKLPIVDVFFNTEKEANLFAENTPQVVTVTIN